MTFSKRLQQLIDQKKISQVELADAVDVTKSRITLWLSGDTKKPQRKKLQTLADYFDCDINWLATGEHPGGDVTTSKNRITAKGGSTVVHGGRDAVNITGGNLGQLSDLEQQLIEQNRKYGNDTMLKKYIAQLEQLRQIIENA